MQQQPQRVLSLAVIVAALGYFVDIYDLLLFAIIRIPSLRSLGLSGMDVDNVGQRLLSVQMAGLLIGGIIWGILGDKKGRLSVLFGSILLYSLANIANGFVHGVGGYTFWRFVAGLGLAGELGAGITLVSEILPKEKRGYGTMLVATVGVSGAVVANLIYKGVSNYTQGTTHEAWRICYWVGGALGLLLLALRISVAESGMYKSVEKSDTKRGRFGDLFNSWPRFAKYMKVVFLGTPTWFVVGIMIAFSNRFAIEMKASGPVNPADAIAYTYIGLTIGDLASGLLSQLLRSRKKVMLLFLTLTAICMTVYFNLQGASPQTFYMVSLLTGFSVGFWAIFVTIGAESFGTNLRATVATTVPNFARGMLVPITWFFQGLQKGAGVSYYQSGIITGAICLAVALIATLRIEETFTRDLNYVEI